MKIGAMMFITDYSMHPAELAEALESRGFESIFIPEHSHIPVSRKSPWPGGAELPKMYYDAMDPFVCLAAASAVTNKIKLCTGICLVVQRDPIQLAKEVASLDRISKGRVILGIGGGWNAEEMADHGTIYKTRFALMRERIEAMKAIWTQNEAEYHGQYVDFDTLMAWPKPVQKPYPSIILGGGFPHGARRAIAYGDGWMPIDGRGADLLEQISQFRQMAAEADRNPDDLELTIFGSQGDTDRVARFADAGVARTVIGLPPANADTVLPLLDDYAKRFNLA